MKKILPLNLKAYEFDDLNEQAKEKVICNHIDFMLEVISYEEGTDNYRRAIDKAEEMRTPWFTGGYVYDYCKDEIIEDIKANDYLFNEKGEILPITYVINNKGEVTQSLLNITRHMVIPITLEKAV